MPATRTYFPLGHSHSFLELDVCQKSLGLGKPSHKMSLGTRIRWLRSYTFPVLRGASGSAEACRHSLEHAHTGHRRRSRQSTHRRYIHRYDLCPRETPVSTGPAQRATEHVCTPIWERLPCSLGPESQAKQTLTVFKNQLAGTEH